MRIQMITLFAGPAGVMQPGSVHDVDAKLGAVLVAGRYAVDQTAAAPAAAPVPPSQPIAMETTAVSAETLTHTAIKDKRKK